MRRGFLAGIAVVLLTGLMAIVATVHLQERQEDREGAVGRAPRGPAKVMSGKVEPRQPKTVKVEVPVDRAVHADTPVFRGEGWFQQNCSVCHVGLWEKQGQGKRGVGQPAPRAIWGDHGHERRFPARPRAAFGRGA